MDEVYANTRSLSADISTNTQEKRCEIKWTYIECGPVDLVYLIISLIQI